MADFHLDDRLSSMLAMTHAIQNRLLQAALKGSISEGVCLEIANHAAAVADHARRLRTEK